MFGKKINTISITACVDNEYCIDIQKCINDHIETVGSHHVYMDGNKVYVGFDTTKSIKDIAKIFELKMTKAQSKIVGGVIFVKFKK